MIEQGRIEAYGQGGGLSWVDRFGVWLSARQIRKQARGLRGKRVADIGCGYHARFALSIAEEAAHVTAVDVALALEVKQHARVTALTGQLPGVLAQVADGSTDVVLCVSVLEHLWDAEGALAGMYRILAPGGVLLLNVPSWRGKWFLEFSAFRLGLSPAVEMDDHKAYYDPRDLWPRLVRAGFKPSRIACFKHKFGLNTFATCRKEG